MFLGPVVLTPVDESKSRTVWQVQESFSYYSRRHAKLIRIPKGFVTDLASVPRVILAWLLVGGTASSAAVVHDFIYHHRIYGEKFPRAMCDDILDEAAEDTRVPKWRRLLIWAGVRAGGWTAYFR